MSYSLGIDAGGTYTDAVLLNDENNTIIQSNKALTSYPDPLEGITEAIDGLDPVRFMDVKVVSVSTTLSTNSILEGTGSPVAMILIGNYDIKQELPTRHFLQVKGGHDHNGVETNDLDEDSIRDFVLQVKDKVSAFAISSYFSVRNHDHELRAKDIIMDLTGRPVVCSYELSQDLGAFERAVTAFLNAQLIPVTERFMTTVESEIRSRGIDAKIFMLKCDGSVIGIQSALKKPIESIFSGPAGSLVGASFLAERETCAVIDVGGTSTDISVIYNGVPEMSDAGAVVGGWKTRVKAIKMETSAMGGDSHVWVKGEKINIGPRRVIPLCRAAVLYPDFLEQLKANPIPSKMRIGVNYQPTKFYLRTDYEVLEASPEEKEVLEAVKKHPTSTTEIFNRIKKYPTSNVFDTLIQKRLLQPIGFTLTDALHVLGEYTERNVEAAEVGADRLGSLVNMDRYEFARYIKREFAKNMACDLVSFFLDGVEKTEIRKIFDIQSPAKFKIEVPVVLIGGPVTAFVEEMQDILDADIVLPEYSSVGNAAGALAAKGIRRFEVLIRPASMAAPDWEFLVFSEQGKSNFYEYKEALDYAVNLGETTVLSYMKDAGLDPSHIKIDIKKEEVIPVGWKTPMETKLVVLGVGDRDN
ncbi:hydantoinase/oxoprolinase N-terminal domain-containing protein [Methanolobus profundi]|uniref:N-methylhydantoinase A/oxoprolinase/acetone carboxylase, beta subunit n=1 Tax=Methanolobus profundi TaxID=487685 RepID=A0A1I4T2X3_9EURY|nr:hydantoinase/oxoprolinase family protein [Methanolobus profundi]SFM71088.1 N-methylhydantoinase A/oxoprolinase/acetone carboxylase, beta subunit [Methanolobus profundi]